MGVEGVVHGFSLRGGGGESGVSGEGLRGALGVLGFSRDVVVAQGEQVHGNKVACVEMGGERRREVYFEDVDGLVTREAGVVLVIRTADCAPVFFWDRGGGVVGLAHSGRRGTEGNIVGRMVEVMGERFGTRGSDLIVVIGPCIRPPFYEVDFAREIGEQARRAGVRDVVDCGLNTGGDLELFYSYRMEKGKTGRHYSVIGRV
jgi:copper oxidase (laccase) domain-containing protein